MRDAAAFREVAAVVVAAGFGSRFGEPKHSLSLAGKPVWKWSVDAFESAGVSEIVVVGDVQHGVAGGPRRRDSVFNGLNALQHSATWVLVHDAARPLVSIALIKRVLEKAMDGQTDGVIPAIAVTDTIKRVNDGRVIDTIDRGGLVAVQTPQAFRLSVLLDAHKYASADDAPDDATLVERIGGTVEVVMGEPTNMKITYRGDLSVAESLISVLDR